MTAVQDTDTVAVVPAPGTTGGRPRRHRPGAGLLAGLVYLVGGWWVARHLWEDPGQRVLVSFPPDHYQFEFWLSHAARIFTHGASPFFTAQLNVPDGVNVMGNVGAYGMTVPLVPVTLIFGPPVAFALMVTLAPSLTALCWYLLFSRRLVRSRWAAAVAGGFCGFAPGIVAQDNVHPHVAMQAAVPLIVWQLLRLRDRELPAWRPGLLIGLLVVYQFFVNEEILLLTALGCLVFVLAWAAFDRAAAAALAGRLMVALAVGGALAALLLAYPMWYQFFGPQHYHGFGDFPDWFGTDLDSFTAFPTQSLAEGMDSLRAANNIVEETAFFGWPLIVMAVAWIAMTWRHAVVRAATVSAVLFTVASLGAYLHLAGARTGVWAPWRLVAHLPLLDSVIASRLVLVVVPMLAVPLALVLDRLLSGEVPTRPGIRAIGLAGVLVALVPLVPLPFAATPRPALPSFVTSGEWRRYVPAGRSMLLIPMPTGLVGVVALQWSAATLDDLPLAGGYFNGPNPDSPDGEGMFGPPHRPTSDLLLGVVNAGRVPSLTDTDRRNAVEDLRHWRASVVVLSPDQAEADRLRVTMTELTGVQPAYTGDVWLWDVRSLTGP
jgi:hypothetical protein